MKAGTRFRTFGDDGRGRSPVAGDDGSQRRKQRVELQGVTIQAASGPAQYWSQAEVAAAWAGMSCACRASRRSSSCSRWPFSWALPTVRLLQLRLSGGVASERLPGTASRAAASRATTSGLCLGLAPIQSFEYSVLVARRRSHETKVVLQMLLDAPREDVYGLEVVRATGLPAGSAYAILRRLEDEGLLRSRWEELGAATAGRPPRRYYQLTGEGRRAAHRETVEERRALRLLAPGWGGS